MAFNIVKTTAQAFPLFNPKRSPMLLYESGVAKIKINNYWNIKFSNTLKAN